MYSSWFQQVRYPLEAVQILQKSIVNQMLTLQQNSKDRSISQHRIKNFISLIQIKTKQAVTFLKDQTQLKKQQLSIIEGQKGFKLTDKKKSTDIIWQNFYDKIKQLKDYQKKQDNINIQPPQNTIQYYYKIVFQPPFKQPQFSIEQNRGKYVDMHNIYLSYINLYKIMQNKKQQNKFHDYLWFLQNMDKFDQFAMGKKFKNKPKYMQYLNQLQQYLGGYIRRSKPLLNFQQFVNQIDLKFIHRYNQGHLPGWQIEHQAFDQTKAQYCSQCQKLFINNQAYINHLVGQKHQKVLRPQIEKDKQKQQEEARKKFKQAHQQRKKQIAIIQHRVGRMRQELAVPIYDTMNLVRKKQTRGYQDVDQLLQSQSQSQQADAPVYNPKNLPLGWDGKPIPYWLYKLHGLGIQYKCEICGNYSYWGRRAFQMHFQQWRHTYGMRCLKIPNTIHFKDVTTISDALALHQKLLRQSQQSQFRPEMEEQFQDNQGNILNKRTYYDMKKQGLID